MSKRFLVIIMAFYVSATVTLIVLTVNNVRDIKRDVTANSMMAEYYDDMIRDIRHHTFNAYWNSTQDLGDKTLTPGLAQAFWIVEQINPEEYDYDIQKYINSPCEKDHAMRIKAIVDKQLGK